MYKVVKDKLFVNHKNMFDESRSYVFSSNNLHLPE